MSLLSTVIEAQLEARRLLVAEEGSTQPFEDWWAFATDPEQFDWLNEHVAPFGTDAAVRQRRAYLLAAVRLTDARYLRPLLANARAIQTEIEDLVDRAIALRVKRDGHIRAFDTTLRALREAIR